MDKEMEGMVILFFVFFILPILIIFIKLTLSENKEDFKFSTLNAANKSIRKKTNEIVNTSKRYISIKNYLIVLATLATVGIIIIAIKLL